MATKKLKKKVQRKPAARKADNLVVDTARDFFLAGLGAFSYVQDEGMKVVDRGNKLFDQLVTEGGKVEKKARKDFEGAFGSIREEIESRVGDVRKEVGSAVGELRGEVESRVDDIREDVETRFEPVFVKGKKVEKQATQGWDKLEGFFEERVAGVMDRLGVVSKEDVDALNKAFSPCPARSPSLNRQPSRLPSPRPKPSPQRKKQRPKRR